MHCLKKSKLDKWVKKMNLICIPFAYKEGMNSGVNISGGKIKNLSEERECCADFSKIL